MSIGGRISPIAQERTPWTPSKPPRAPFSWTPPKAYYACSPSQGCPYRPSKYCRTPGYAPQSTRRAPCSPGRCSRGSNRPHKCTASAPSATGTPHTLGSSSANRSSVCALQGSWTVPSPPPPTICWPAVRWPTVRRIRSGRWTPFCPTGSHTRGRRSLPT